MPIMTVYEKVALRRAEKKGREEGRAEGRVEGREEVLTAHVRKMLEYGVSVEQVTMFTGLTEDEITSLVNGTGSKGPNIQE